MPAQLKDPNTRSPAKGGIVLGAHGLRKRYGRGDSAVEALRGVDIEIQAGEIVVIMGPSGCGKTTLLHLLGGIEIPDQGEVLLCGEPMPRNERQLAEVHRHVVCFVFQGFGVIAGLSARENVEFPLIAAGVAADERQERTLAALGDVGLLPWKDHLPDELSGGQRQRVAIARALVPNPTVIMADEPTGNLDTTTGQEVLDLLLTSARKRDCAIVMVTHDAAAAERADRVLYLRDGLIVAGEEEAR